MNSPLPQLDFSTYGGQVFWLAIFFLALYSLTSRLFLPAISRALQIREDRIRTDLEKASALRKEADHLLQEYHMHIHSARERAKNVVAEARTVSEKNAVAKEARLRDEIRKRTQEAVTKAETAAQKAESELRSAAYVVAQATLNHLPGNKAQIRFSDISGN